MMWYGVGAIGKIIVAVRGGRSWWQGGNKVDRRVGHSEIQERER